MLWTTMIDSELLARLMGQYCFARWRLSTSDRSLRRLNPGCQCLPEFNLLKLRSEVDRS